LSFSSEIVCLGRIIGSGKLKPDPRKISAMKEFPLPLTKKDMRSFLGVTGYYRQYIKDYAHITAPLRMVSPALFNLSNTALT
jgi:hypothetical protein